MPVDVGDMAPDFTLPTDEGSSLTLSDLRGQRVVLYFYPKDDTSGCTKQACSLRDEMPAIEDQGAVVLGVSPDPVESHRAFKAKYGLNFPLLADTDRAVSRSYGVWKERSMYGRSFLGIERSTFIIGEDGTVLHAWRHVKPADHGPRVAEALRESG